MSQKNKQFIAICNPYRVPLNIICALPILDAQNPFVPIYTYVAMLILNNILLFHIIIEHVTHRSYFTGGGEGQNKKCLKCKLNKGLMLYQNVAPISRIIYYIVLNIYISHLSFTNTIVVPICHDDGNKSTDYCSIGCV